MYYPDEALAQMKAELESITPKHQALVDLFLRRVFQKPRAREFAEHGYLRRLKTLARCAENLFALIPPNQNEMPEQSVRVDAEINLQASVFSTFGAADNLAWIWVIERDVVRPNGSPLPETWIGLRKSNKDVRASFPKGFRDYLEGMDDWFDHLDNYRHALAHRIPLYIPPFAIEPNNAEAYRALEQRKLDASAAGNLAETDQFDIEQKALVFFRPWLQHSFHEDARTIQFHPQILANFNTIEEMGRKLLEELER